MFGGISCQLYPYKDQHEWTGHVDAQERDLLIQALLWHLIYENLIFRKKLGKAIELPIFTNIVHKIPNFLNTHKTCKVCKFFKKFRRFDLANFENCFIFLQFSRLAQNTNVVDLSYLIK